MEDDSLLKAQHEIHDILNKYDITGTMDRCRLLGNVIHSEFFHNSSRTCYDAGLPNDGFSWTADHVIATEMGVMLPRLLNLRDWLVEGGYTSENCYDDFESAEKLAVMHQSDDLSIILACTEYYSYFVVITSRKDFVYDGDEKKEVESHRIDVRLITDDVFRFDPTQDCAFEGLQWLSSIAEVKTSPYYKCRDFRDQGYIISAEQCRYQDTWKAEKALQNYRMQSMVMFHLYDLLGLPARVAEMEQDEDLDQEE